MSSSLKRMCCFVEIGAEFGDYGFVGGEVLGDIWLFAQIGAGEIAYALREGIENAAADQGFLKRVEFSVRLRRCLE